jgi:hypothetical protein
MHPVSAIATSAAIANRFIVHSVEVCAEDIAAPSVAS